MNLDERHGLQTRAPGAVRTHIDVRIALPESNSLTQHESPGVAICD